MKDESSLEFDMFEDVRRTLTEVLVAQGRDLIEAERVALYVVQGIRDVPKFLTTIVRGDKTDADIRKALDAVLENSTALERARAILSGQDDQIVH